MIEGRYFNGRDMTEEERDTILRIIREVNVEVVIEDGQVLIEAECGGVIEPLARCDLIRLAARSADYVKQSDGDTGVYALAGLFNKCANLILNETDPCYKQTDESTGLGSCVRLFAGDDTENPEEDEEDPANLTP
jgi:hypothetical protein